MGNGEGCSRRGRTSSFDGTTPALSVLTLKHGSQAGQEGNPTTERDRACHCRAHVWCTEYIGMTDGVVGVRGKITEYGPGTHQVRTRYVPGTYQVHTGYFLPGSSAQSEKNRRSSRPFGRNVRFRGPRKREIKRFWDDAVERLDQPACKQVAGAPAHTSRQDLSGRVPRPEGISLGDQEER